ncbi:hypothetical protein ACFQ1S_08965, partial [Kibdelosporangium lantanae]
QTTTAPASERQQDGTTLPTGTPHIIPAEGTGTVPPRLLVPVPDRDENPGEDVRQAARRRYLKTLADGLPCTGRELADMYGMSERWGRYQIRAARRTHTTPTTQEAPSQEPDAHER